MEGRDVFLFQGVNTVQMCCAVRRSDFIHEYKMEISVVLTVLDSQRSEKRRRKEKERKKESNKQCKRGFIVSEYS